jgi:hypothetical protein
LTTGADGLRYRRAGPFIQLEVLRQRPPESRRTFPAARSTPRSSERRAASRPFARPSSSVRTSSNCSATRSKSTRRHGRKRGRGPCRVRRNATHDLDSSRRGAFRTASARLTEHLDRCKACARFAATLEQMTELLRASPRAAPTRKQSGEADDTRGRRTAGESRSPATSETATAPPGR